MSAVAMQSFGFGDKLVRAVDRGGIAWFVGVDVCGALEIGNSRDALSRLEEDERDCVGITDAIGRDRETTIISESGVYSLAFTSRKEAAKRFKRWVTHEVLPAIRTTGRYIVAPDNDMDNAGFDVPDDYDTLSKKLALAREARVVFGIRAARIAWKHLGLMPALTDGVDEMQQLPSPVIEAMRPSVADWLRSRVETGPSYKTSTMVLYDDFVLWCAGEPMHRGESITVTAFSLMLNSIGFVGTKGEHGRRVKKGLRLRE